MLTKKQLQEIREELDNCKKPLFFFHDDSDGLCAFLLLYRYIKEGKGIVVKSHPNIDLKFLQKVEEYQPDKIFILDIALVEQDFINECKTPIVWIDHHDPIKRRNVKYYNPRIQKQDDNISASHLCYEVVEQDLWLGVVGAVGDWTLPSFIDEFREKYPEMLPKNIKDPGKALFDTKLGYLIKIFNFILKGKTQEVMKSVKILTRIESPYEILNQETPRGKFIYKRFKKINELYEELIKEAMQQKGKVVSFLYKENKMSFTGELANELLYRNKNKVVVIAREKAGEMKCSIRSPKRIDLNNVLPKAIEGLDGYFGGHEHAMGACVKKKDFKVFLERIEKSL